MSDQNTKNLSTDNFAILLKNLIPEEIKSNISLLTSEQQAQLTERILHSKGDEWKERLISTIGGLANPSALENVGRFLKGPHFLYLLSHKKEIEGANQDKVSSLLVGMPNLVFNEILSQLNENERNVLRQEAGAEPLQHQLTLFSHELTFQLEIFTNKLREMEREIDSIDLARITYQTLENFNRGIDTLRTTVDTDLRKINNALALSWNTSRGDLIESFSFQKESRQKYRNYIVGHPPSETKAGTGFYARLISHLNGIFSDAKTPNNIEALRDDEPAIEALAKFSLWYLEDYMEVGILNRTLSELDLNNLSYSDQERAEYRGSLYVETQNNLAAIGLSTVKDLKEKQIFSKEILKDYIKINTEKA